MAQPVAAVYVTLVPALVLPHGQVAGVIDESPVNSLGFFGDIKSCHYYHHHKMLENILILYFVLEQTLFSALDSQPMLILLLMTDPPSSSLKKLRKEGEEFPC